MTDGPRNTLEYARPGHERPANRWVGVLWTLLGLTIIAVVGAVVLAFILWVAYIHIMPVEV